MRPGVDNAAMAIENRFTLQFVSVEEWMEVAQRYQHEHPATPSTARIEVETEQRIYEQLCQKWVNGWDFCTAIELRDGLAGSLELA
ncbi:hypothetical protein [Verrucomicrobium spinosum]|uniref:hypothetical protein n=1 Tax=Verrucomicrobium spinosum TaxID=2736 RepID=UPI0001745017|nr:hypothetical protein [Verrucomicrobium spinosum]